MDARRSSSASTRWWARPGQSSVRLSLAWFQRCCSAISGSPLSRWGCSSSPAFSCCNASPPAGQRLELYKRSSQRFQSPSLRLTLQPSSLRTFCRLRRSSFLARDGDTLNERAESSEGLLSILLLAPILLGLDGNHALS